MYSVFYIHGKTCIKYGKNKTLSNNAKVENQKVITEKIRFFMQSLVISRQLRLHLRYFRHQLPMKLFRPNSPRLRPQDTSW